MRQWFGARWGELPKILSCESGKLGIERRRGITGSESQAGKFAAKSVLEDESGEG